MTPERKERWRNREVDSRWELFLAALLRHPLFSRAVAKAIGWMLTGGLVSVGIYRYTVIDRLQAQEVAHTGRMTSIEKTRSLDSARYAARFDTVFQRLASVDSVNRFTMKDICVRYSKYDQRWLELTCPSEFFKGAKR